MPYDSTFPSRSRTDDGSTIIDWENGERYQGEFFKNCFHGKGTYTWADEVSYSGFFYVNKRHGYGRQQFSDGRTFTGLYKDDHQYGAGIMEYPANTEDVGFWKGEYLFRLCSSNRSIPSFQEVAIGYSSGGDKVKKTIELAAEFRRPFPVDEYLNSSDIGAKISATVRESLYSNSIPNPDSMFFNRRLFNYVFQKSLAHEKKQVAIKAQINEYETNIKMIKAPKTNQVTDFLKLKSPQLKASMMKFTSEAPVVMQEDQWQVFQADKLNLESGKIPDCTEIMPDCPLTMISWNNNPQLIEIQKYSLYYQNFLAIIGFPIEKLMSFNREYQKPPGEMESSSNQLFQLAYDGDSTGALRLFLNHSVHPDVCDAKGNTPLIVASMQCHDEMINFLLDMGAGVNNSNDDGLTPLGLCIVQLQPASSLIFDYRSLRLNVDEIILECMLSPVEKAERKLKVVPEMESNSPPRARRLHPVTYRISGDDSLSGKGKPRVGVLSKLPKTQSSPEKQTPSLPEDDLKTCYRRTVPSQKQLLTTLKLLLSRGANIDVVLVPANPIMIAVRSNNVDLLRLLLQSGANPNIYHQEKDYGRFAPLHFACSIPTEAAVTLATVLLEHGANPDLLAEEDRPLLTESTDENISTSTLLEKCVTSECLSPLLIAAARPDFETSVELIQLLLQFKCNPSPPLFAGHSPLSVAIAAGNERAIKALLLGGADPNRAIGEEIGPIVAVVLSTQLNNRWEIGKRLKIAKELITFNANVVGPFKLGINKRVGSLMDFVKIMYSKESRESKFLSRDDDKLMVIEKLPSYIQNAVKVTVVNPNRNNVALRNKLKADMDQRRTENIDIALRNIPPNVLPMEMCYECCRSCGLSLQACTRCYSVLYCSRLCQMKAWDYHHQEECFENDVIPVQFLKKIAQRVPFDCQLSDSTTHSQTHLPRGSVIMQPRASVVTQPRASVIMQPRASVVTQPKGSQAVLPKKKP